MIYQWLDLIWLPIGLFVVNKDQRLWVLGFFAGCMLMMRMQVELMHTTGYPTGFINLMSSQALDRGLLIYSIFYVLYLVLAHYSPNTKGPIFVAGSISIFFMAFFTSSIIMVL